MILFFNLTLYDPIETPLIDLLVFLTTEVSFFLNALQELDSLITDLPPDFNYFGLFTGYSAPAPAPLL